MRYLDVKNGVQFQNGRNLWNLKQIWLEFNICLGCLIQPMENIWMSENFK